MTGSARIEFLPWDTEFWGFRAARLHANTVDDLADADKLIAEDKIRWVSLLAPSTDVALVNAAVRLGYTIVDTRITLSKQLADSGEPTRADLALADDTDQMAAIAATAFPLSRFSVDPHLDDQRCELFYDTWVRNSMNGQMADAVVVSRHDGLVDGFVTMRLRPDRTASLPLVAIRSDRRGRGVGKRLATDAVGWLVEQGAMNVDVVTQLSNLSAVRLYESVGFQTIDAGHWLHRWY
jgi:dTDP-4-amino-4,6-dideoxy-D-galactose acyltransferase